jgi:hypothetical protein
VISPTLARIPVLLRWNVNDGLNGQKLIARSFATELEGVLARTSTKYVADRNGVLLPLPQGLPPLTWLNGEPAMLLEPARTNLALRSEELNNAAWTNSSVTVTANGERAPDGTITADILAATTASTNSVSQAVTFTGDGEKCASVFLKARADSVTTIVTLQDGTVPTNRHSVRVTWTAGVPSLSTDSGAGTLYPVELLTNGWYRILFSATGIVAANTNRIVISPDGTGTTGSVHVWGVQVENGVVPSSYIKTEGSTVARAADSLYFPFTAPPQAMTVYARGRERGTRLEPGAYIWQVSQSNNNPRVHLNRTSGTARMQTQTVNSAATFSTLERASSGADSNVGDLAEYRSIIGATGGIGFGVSLNGGAELVSTPISGTALEAAWSGQRLWIGTSGGGAAGLFGFTHIVVAAGEQSLATMRELAGV